MHEDAIASVAEIEGHGFVHARSLGSLRVGDEELHFLSHLVERGERLSTPVYPFLWCEREDGVDAPGVVGATLYEVKRQNLHLCGVVVGECACLGELASVFVFQDDAPWIFLYLYGAVRRGVAHGGRGLLHLPRRVATLRH